MLTADQLELRKSGIGASELPAVLGLDPYTTPIDVYALKTGLIASDAGNVNTRLGDLMEPVLLTLYGEMRSAVVYPSPGTLRHSAEPWLLATPDAVAGDVAPIPPGHVGWAPVAPIDRVVEVKHRGHWNRSGWGVAGTDQVPDSVAIQVHAQLAVTGYAFGDVAVLIGGGDLRFYRIHADECLMATALEIGRHFWTHHVQARVIPPATPQDNEKLGRLLRQSTELLKPATMEVECALAELRDIRIRMKEDQLERDRLEAVLKAYIGADAGVQGDAGRVTWKTSRPGSTTDWAAVAKLLNERYDCPLYAEIVQQHSREVPGSRRFLPTFTTGDVTV